VALPLVMFIIITHTFTVHPQNRSPPPSGVLEHIGSGVHMRLNVYYYWCILLQFT